MDKLNKLFKYASIIDISKFRSYVSFGYITDYDGDGYFVDKCGNNLGPVVINDRSINAPKETAFVAWYNR